MKICMYYFWSNFFFFFFINYQALANEKDNDLKIKATEGKLCYLDLSI